MKRKGEALSIKSLNAQINAMMQAICLIEDEDSRIQFMKRLEVVQRDLHCLHSELESKMPRNLKRPSTLNIDHSLCLIGSPEEGYTSLTKPIWQSVQDVTQRIDRLSEGLAFVVQRHSRHLQASRYNEDNSGSDSYPRDSDLHVQNNTQHDELGGSNYSFKYSQSNPDGHQVQISFSHARRYYHPSSGSQAEQHNQFTRGPNYFNPQSATDMNPHGRFSTRTSSSSQLEASRYYPHGYFAEHPSDSFSYFPEGRHSQHGGPSSQARRVPQPSHPSFWCIPSDMSNIESSLHEYPRNSQRMGAWHTDFSHYSQD